MKSPPPIAYQEIKLCALRIKIFERIGKIEKQHFTKKWNCGAIPLIYLVPLARVERAAHGLGIRCSILLSYRGNRIYGSFRGLTCFLGGVNDKRLLPASEA